MIKTKILIYIFLLSFVFLPSVVGATIVSTAGGSLDAKITPYNPKPFEEVTINLFGYGFKIENSEIVWSVDGQIAQQGFGKKSFSFKVGDIGSVSSINIVINSKERGIMLKNITFQPADADIVIETNSYTPPSYQGSSLPSQGSEIKLVAIPRLIDSQNKRIANDDLKFNWKKDGNNLTSQSGIGKNYIIFTADEFKASHKIDLEIIYQPEKIVIEKSLTINLFQPEILIYEVNPLSGVDYSRAIGDEFELNKDEITLKAEPFYLSQNQKGLLGYYWRLNDQLLTMIKGRPEMVALEKPASLAGSANLSLIVESLNKVIGRKNIVVRFGSTIFD